jgi:hypothetical protein
MMHGHCDAVPDSKTVFALRREGRLDDALAMGRELIAADPGNVWNVRSLGWVLCDLIKHSIEAGDREQTGILMEELGALPIAADDELLAKQRERLRGQASPVGAVVAKARAADKAGNLTEALLLYRQAVKTMPASKETQTGLGWVIAKMLKTEAAVEMPEQAKVVALLKEYLHLLLVEKPSNLHSLILAHATRLQKCLEVLYPIFVQKWGIEHLRSEDFAAYKPEGKDESYPALAEKVGMALGKSIKGIKHSAIPAELDPAWVSTVLGQLMQKFPDQMWLAYHHAKSLLLSGSPESARAALLPIVRAKSSEFWAWSVLGDTFGEGTPDRLACLSRALLCKGQDMVYLKAVVRHLHAELVMAGETVAATRLDLPQGEVNTPAIIRELTPVLEKYAPAADDIVFQDLPWLDAIVSGRVEPEADIKGNVFLLVRSGNGQTEVRVGMRKFTCLEKARLGSPVAVRMVTVDQRERVVDARVREGQPWDLVPEYAGVVKHVNHEKGLLAIAVGVDVTTLAHFDRFPEVRAWVAGDIVAARCRKVQQGALPVLVSVRRAETTPSNTFCRSYSGHLTLLDSGSAGFVGDVYVPGSLIKSQPEPEMSCQGLSVLETNPKTGKRGWKALTFQSK